MCEKSSKRLTFWSLIWTPFSIERSRQIFVVRNEIKRREAHIKKLIEKKRDFFFQATICSFAIERHAHTKQNTHHHHQHQTAIENNTKPTAMNSFHSSCSVPHAASCDRNHGASWSVLSTRNCTRETQPFRSLAPRAILLFTIATFIFSLHNPFHFRFSSDENAALSEKGMPEGYEKKWVAEKDEWCWPSFFGALFHRQPPSMITLRTASSCYPIGSERAFSNTINIITFAQGLKESEYSKIPLCTTSFDRALFDSDSSPYFVFGDGSLSGTEIMLSSSSVCSRPYSSMPTSRAMSVAHARFGLMGNDFVGLCDFSNMFCRLPLVTGAAVFRKGRDKSDVLRDITSSINGPSSLNSLPRVATLNSLNIAPTSAIYSPMFTTSPYVPIDYGTNNTPPKIQVDVELQPSLFEKTFQIDTDANAFAVEFALSVYGTCADASDMKRMTYRSTPSPIANSAANLQERKSNTGGSRNAAVVKLLGELPPIPAAWRSSTTEAIVPIVLCMRLASHKYLQSTPTSPKYGEWFSMPQLSGVPFHSIIASKDGGAFYNNTYLPIIADSARNQWEVYDLTQHDALVALVNSNPLLFTPSYVSAPRAGIPNPYRPLFGNWVRLHINKAIIDKSPWLYFAIDTTLDVCNVHLRSNFTKSDLGSYNATHYEIRLFLRKGEIAGYKFGVGGANATLCGSSAPSGGVWMPISTRANPVYRCPFARAFVSELKTSSGNSDDRGCFSCAARDGDTQPCAGNGVCGGGSFGFLEVQMPRCVCNLGAKYNVSTNCRTRNGIVTNTQPITLTQTLTKNSVTPPLPKYRNKTHSISATQTVSVSELTPTISLTPRLPLTCYLNVEEFKPPLTSHTAGAGGPPIRIASACHGAVRDALQKRHLSLSFSSRASTSVAREAIEACVASTGGYLYARPFFPSEIGLGSFGARYSSPSAVAGALAGMLLVWLFLAANGLGSGFFSETLFCCVFKTTKRQNRPPKIAYDDVMNGKRRSCLVAISSEISLLFSGVRCRGPSSQFTDVSDEIQRRAAAAGAPILKTIKFVPVENVPVGAEEDEDREESGRRIGQFSRSSGLDRAGKGAITSHYRSATDEQDRFLNVVRACDDDRSVCDSVRGSSEADDDDDCAEDEEDAEEDEEGEMHEDHQQEGWEGEDDEAELSAMPCSSPRRNRAEGMKTPPSRRSNDDRDDAYRARSEHNCSSLSPSDAPPPPTARSHQKFVANHTHRNAPNDEIGGGGSSQPVSPRVHRRGSDEDYDDLEACSAAPLPPPVSGSGGNRNEGAINNDDPSTSFSPSPYADLRAQTHAARLFSFPSDLGEINPTNDTEIFPEEERTGGGGEETSGEEDLEASDKNDSEHPLQRGESVLGASSSWRPKNRDG